MQLDLNCNKLKIRSFLVLLVTIGFVLALNAQEDLGILDYAKSNLLSTPVEIAQHTKDILQHGGLKDEHVNDIKLLGAQANYLLENYDLALDLLNQINLSAWTDEPQNQFVFHILNAQISFQLGLFDDYKSNLSVANKLAVRFADNSKQFLWYLKVVDRLNVMRTAQIDTATTLNADLLKLNSNRIKFLETHNLLALSYIKLVIYDDLLQHRVTDIKGLWATLNVDQEEKYHNIYNYYLAYLASKQCAQQGEFLMQKSKLDSSLQVLKGIDGFYFTKANSIEDLLQYGKQNKLSAMVLSYHNFLQDIQTHKNSVISKALNAVFSNQLKFNAKSQNQLAKTHTTVIAVVWGIGLSLIVTCLIILIRYRWQHKHLNEVKAFLNRMNTADTKAVTQQKLQADDNQKSDSTRTKREDPQRTKLSGDIVKQVLEGLHKFEKEEIFLRKNISLAFVASYVNVNTKYLSEVLNNECNESFSAYINRLKIEYIVDKLQSSPEYLKYKISYLADESGYSSHSSFSTAFKAVTGMPPTRFIGLLKQNNL